MVSVEVDRKTYRRFWSKVRVGDECWEWVGGKSRGYGSFSYQGKIRKAHRFAYELLVGPIPEGLELDHLRPFCSTRACVRPDHLEPVTHEENSSRVGRRLTHCKRGHEFTPENTRVQIVRQRGKTYRWRKCKTCQREGVKRFVEANPEKAREYNRRYREANPEKLRNADRQRRRANPEKAREAQRRYRGANRDKLYEAGRRYWEANREKINVAKRARYQEKQRAENR